jgi:cellulose synthase/poly-beta-1,6-N-acetylglucosamine synthase-like glycosyltransferase
VLAAKIAFWTCALLTAHTYVLYPVVLFVAYAIAQIRRDMHYLVGRRDRRRPTLDPRDLPAVSLVVPAYNEDAHLADKLANIRALDYPCDKLQVVFVSDGSTDGTNDILHGIRDDNVAVVLLPERRGKPYALNAGVQRAVHDIVVLCDAATVFERDALQNLVRHFCDPTVGVVCGALRFQSNLESQRTEGTYWRYEGMLRLMEGRLGATLTASGAMYALRRACFRPLGTDDIIDDFVLPMYARALGYRVLYDPEAMATEFAASSVKGEFTRRVRISVGSFFALRAFLRVPLGPMTSFAFLSHKLLRWVLPFLMIGMLVSNIVLAGEAFYRLLLAGQLAFYTWAAAGFLFRRPLTRVRFGLLGYFLVAMHVAYLVGFIRFMRRRQEGLWQRVS